MNWRGKSEQLINEYVFTYQGGLGLAVVFLVAVGIVTFTSLTAGCQESIV